MTLLFCVELQGGLANRLRTLWSAEAFARRYRRPVLVLWPINGDLACASRSLFQVSGNLVLIDVDLSRPPQRRLLRLARWLLSSLRLGLNRPVDPGQAWGQPLRYAPRWMPFQWIQTCAAFEDSSTTPPPFLPLASLKGAAAARVAVARHRSAPLIGIHVRRGDHQLATTHSQTSLFLEAIHGLLRRDPETRFLLCTDDPREVEHFRQVLGDRVCWTSPDSLDRGQPASASAAMIDFLSLAGCDAILGSYLSSFSLLAARCGAIPITLVGDPEPIEAA